MVAAVEVSGRQPVVADQQLTGCTDRYIAERPVDHPQRHAGRRATDRYVGDVAELDSVGLVDHAADDGLGRAVLVEDAHTRERAPQPSGQACRERLTADDERAQVARRLEAEKQLEMRGGRLAPGQIGPPRDVAEPARSVGADDHEPTTGDEWHEQAGHRQIERERAEEWRDGHDVAVDVRLERELDVPGEAGVRDRHTLRFARRARREEQVGLAVAADLRERHGGAAGRRAPEARRAPAHNPPARRVVAGDRRVAPDRAARTSHLPRASRRSRRRRRARGRVRSRPGSLPVRRRPPARAARR